MGSGFPVVLTFKPGTVINFKDCYLGEQAQVVCTMKNESEFLPIMFRFRKTAHFSVSPKRGKLKKKSEKVSPSLSLWLCKSAVYYVVVSSGISWK